MPGNCTQQSDGRQAYTQALHKGIKTWVRLPKYRWQKGWASKFSDPVVQLVLALYGHPDSVGLWEKTFFYPLVSVLYTLEPGLQFSGIQNFDSCSQCMSTTSRCRVRLRMWQKGGNSFLPKLIWIQLQQLVAHCHGEGSSFTRTSSVRSCFQP